MNPSVPVPPVGEPVHRIDDPRRTDRIRFILANTRRTAAALVPEIRLHLADEAVPLWHRTEEALARQDVAPPYWAFAWAGGQVLARHVLDHPSLVRGRTVVDLGSGCGIAAIAAARAGARRVTAAEIDPFAQAAAALNASLNRVRLAFLAEDILGGTPETAEVVLAGDLFYERETAVRVENYLGACLQAGASVLIGDPERTYLPRERLFRLATYDVPVHPDLEDRPLKRTSIWTLLPHDSRKVPQ